MGIWQVMQSPADIWSTHKEEKAKQDRAQKEKDARDGEFFAGLRAKREAERAEFLEKRRVDEEKIRAEAVPLKQLPELPPALILGEPHDSSAPALINPSPTLKRGVGVDVLGAAEEGIFGFGLLGVLRKRIG